MSFIVSMVKYLILAGLFIVLVAGVIGLLFLFSDTSLIPPEAKFSMALGGWECVLGDLE